MWKSIAIVTGIGVMAIMSGCSTPVTEQPMAAGTYVRLVEENGRYWFSHEGERFLALGVNCVLPADGAREEGKKKCYNVWPAYNGNEEQWAAAAAQRLQQWNFNTIAAWSREYLYENVPMYHTRVIWFGHWGSARDMRLIDVFSDDYARSIEETAVNDVAPHAANPFLIGYFINNELPWYGLRGWPTDPNVSLLSRYMQLPPLAPGKQRLVAFLQSYYHENFDALQKDWKVEAASFDALDNVRRLIPRAPSAKASAFAWTGIVADRYFLLCTEAIRRHDPNHLVLGSRFAGNAPVPVIKACGKYCDVVSINHYRKTGEFNANLLGTIAALTERPIMITEYSWRAMQNASGCPNSLGADVTVATQADRAQNYEQYAAAALRQPYIVGLDWFQYFDQPPGGRFDGEDSNYGLVDIHDQPYTQLVSSMTAMNRRAEKLHAQSDVPPPEIKPEVLDQYRELKLRGSGSPPAAALAWADGTTKVSVYGDQANGGHIEIGEPGSFRKLTVHTGDGWGCGISLPAPRSDHPDGSANVLGAQEIVVRLNAAQPFTFNVGLNESGHGPVESQTFDGYGNADGEAFTHMYIQAEAGARTYRFRLANMENNPYHGNQRGNLTIDTDALTDITLFFPPDQGVLAIELVSVTVE
jgi:hypothetical protein